MYVYKNKETEVEIVTESELSGDWELVKEVTKSTKKTKSEEESDEEQRCNMNTLEPFASVDDLEILWRKVEIHELCRSEELLRTVSHVLRVEAKKVKKD